MIRNLIISLVSFGFLSFVSAQCHSGNHDHGMHDNQSTNSIKKSITLSAQINCPIMGNPIDKEVFTLWEGDKNTPKKVYFCCPGCIKTFEKNPVKFINKLKKMNQTVENVTVNSTKFE